MVTIPANLENFVDKGVLNLLGICVGVTASDSLRGDALGEEYQNDQFVSDYNNDYLYGFGLSDIRTKLDLEGDLVDKIANDNEELRMWL